MYSIVLMSMMAGPATPPAGTYYAPTPVVTVRTTAVAYGAGCFGASVRQSAGCSGSFAASAGCSGGGVEGRAGLLSRFRERERRFNLFGRRSGGCGG